MSRTSASFTPGPLVATTTPARRRKCRRSPREAGRRVRQMLTTLKPTVVTDSVPIGLEGRAQSVDRGPAPDTFLTMTDGVWEERARV